IHMQGQETRRIMMSGVSPAKRDLVIEEPDQAVIRDCDTMGVGSEVTQARIGPSEWRLAIDHPAMTEKLTDKTPPQLGLSEALEQAVKAELSGSTGLLQCLHEFATEHLAENCYGEKEVVAPGINPMGVVRRQTAGSNDAVNMGMMQQLLVPGAQNTEEADLGVEVLGVAGNLD